MSNTDSFIEEVTEEVRRDTLYGHLKSYGWIAVAVIVMIVAGTAYNEYSRSLHRTQAQSVGDQLFAALELEEPKEQLEALNAIKNTGQADPIKTFAIANHHFAQGESKEAQAVLVALAANEQAPQVYRNLAQYKAFLHAASQASQDSELQNLQGQLDAFGAAALDFRLLALEQMALIDLKLEQQDAAIEKLRSILEDAQTSSRLKERSTQLLVSLGQDIAP